MNEKPLFLYLKNCKLSKSALERIEQAGYIPIPVASFADVRIVESTVPLRSVDEVSRAAMAAISCASFDSVRESFGGLVAKILAQPPKTD